MGRIDRMKNMESSSVVAIRQAPNSFLALILFILPIL